MNEQFARVGEIEICYETFGDPGDPAALMIMGLGTQMLGWPDDLCAQLAERGFFVIRFDNRDVGRSTQIRDVAPPSPVQLLRRSKAAAGYTLDDMADDAAGLLDAMGIERAHVIGASMGGMIAQTIAVRHPGRVLSLVSVMSTTGHRRHGQPSPRVYDVFLKRAPREPQAYADHMVNLFRRVGSKGFPFDEGEFRQRALAGLARGGSAAGVGRQMAAIIASGDRTEQLRTITAPTLVIHGDHDLMVSPSGGRATAKAIPGARLMVIEGMGHDLPRGVWDRILDGIEVNAALAADGRETAAA